MLILFNKIINPEFPYLTKCKMNESATKVQKCSRKLKKVGKCENRNLNKDRSFNTVEKRCHVFIFGSLVVILLK